MSKARIDKAIIFLVVVSLLLNLVPLPALADDVDVAANPPTDWSVAGAYGGSGDIVQATDEDDATYEGIGLNVGESNCSSRTIHSVTKWTCSGAIEFSRTGGPADVTITDFRLLWDACISGQRPTCGTPAYWMYALRLSAHLASDYPPSGCSETAGEIYYYAFPPTTSANGGYDTGVLPLDTPVTIDISTKNRVCYQIQWDYHTGIAADSRLYTWELYAGVTPEAVIDEWIYGLRLDHPPFTRVISWHWLQDHTIAWWVTDSGGTLEPADLLGNPYSAGDEQRVVIFCPFVCGHETYVLHVVPDGYLETTYEIDSDLDGVLIGGSPGLIAIGGVTACYNADFEQCGDDQLASTVHLTYAIIPSDEPDDVLVEIGSEYLFGPGFDDDAWYSDTVDGGTHVVDITTDSPYPVEGQRLLIVATGPNNARQALITCPWVDGGTCGFVSGGGSGGTTGGTTGGGGGGDGDGIEPCGPVDPVCAIRNAVGSVLSGIYNLFVPCGMGEHEDTDECSSLGEVVTSLLSALSEKWPFAWVLGGAEAIASFYGAIGEVITDWGGEEGEWCYDNDLVIGRPTIGDVGATTTLESVEFCLDTAWLDEGYPAYASSIRPILGGGIYILALFQLARHFAPKPVITG